MLKEKIVALGLGILLGSISAIWTVSFFHNAQIKKNTLTIIKKDKDLKKKIKKELLRPGFFDVESPTDGDLFKEKEIVIKGKAPRNSLIIAQSPVTEKDIVNKKEEFELKFPLAEGKNVIHLTLYNKNIQVGVLEKKFRVYLFSDEK